MSEAVAEAVIDMSRWARRLYDPRDMLGQSYVDWEERIDPASLRRKRLERAREKMKEAGLGALLLFRHENIRYVTGMYEGMWQLGNECLRYCLLAGDADPIVFEMPGIDYICHHRGAPWVKDMRFSQVWRGAGPAGDYMVTRFAQGIKSLLAEHGVAGEKVGIDALDFLGFNALQTAGIQLTDGTSVIHNAGIIKFPEELEIMKQACAIQDAAYFVISDMMKPGVKEIDLKAAIMHELYRLGAERVEQITMASGGRTMPLWRSGSTDKILRCGDMVIIDICYQYMGYNTCYYRNFVVGGKPTAKQKALHKASYDAMYAAINLCRPGVTTAEVADVWRGMGYSDGAYGSVSMLQFGHGLGVSCHEPPFITLAYSKQFPVTLAKDMYLAIETYAGTPEDGEAARLEENLVITDSGASVFSLYPFPEYFFD